MEFDFDLARAIGSASAPGRSVPAASGATDEAPYLEQDALRFFYRWGGLLSSTMTRIRGRFQGDLDQYLIFLVFLLDDLRHEIASRRGARDRSTRARGLNALSISEVTEIPRETARRKLQMLLAAGFVERGEDGLYYLGPRYSRDQFFFDVSPLFLDCMGAAPSSDLVEPKPQPADR